MSAVIAGYARTPFVKFTGAFDGMAALIIVIITMLVAEEAIARLYRRLQ